MKITQLNISEFGRLKNTQITLDDGINIISGDNESGKSTIMLFIRFMFYGLPKKSQKSNLRERSLSFDTHRAAGSMTVQKDGREYRIERTAAGTTKVNETRKIIDMQSGELIAGEPWELFLGVGADVFESSCAVHQAKASGIDKAGTARALENILASADESIDVSGILDNIDKVRREYKLNRGEGGLLYDLGREIAELEAKKQRATEKQLRINKLSADLARLENELESIEKDKEAAEKSLDVAKKAQILAGFDELDRKRSEKESLEAELAALEADFPHKNILPTEQTAADIENACGGIRAARKKIETRRDEHRELTERSESAFPLANLGEQIVADGGAEFIAANAIRAQKISKRFTGCTITALFLTAISVLASILFNKLLIIAAIGCGALSVIFPILSAKKKKESKSICQKYAQDISTLCDYLKKCEAELEGLKNSRHELTAAAAKLDAAEQDLEIARGTLAALIDRESHPTSADELLVLGARICSDIRTLCAKKNDIRLKIAACDALIVSRRASLAEYDEKALRASLGALIDTAMDLYAAERALSFAIRKKESVVRDIGLLRENLAASRGAVGEDPIELGDKISALHKKLDERERYFDALMLAKQTIERASDAMSGNVTPEISQRASEIMELISEGRHPALRTTKQLELSVDEDGFGFSAELLSEGARDAAYIALRISLMLHIFRDQLPPLMLDDALCQFDDGRAKIMIELISKLAELPLQSIIFTCHAREHSICDENGIRHTYTHLS